MGLPPEDILLSLSRSPGPYAVETGSGAQQYQNRKSRNRYFSLLVAAKRIYSPNNFTENHTMHGNDHCLPEFLVRGRAALRSGGRDDRVSKSLGVLPHGRASYRGCPCPPPVSPLSPSP